MKFYVDTIEQVKGEEEGTINEYGKRDKYNTESSAFSNFYKKLSDVSVSNAHIFMDIKIVNSDGGIIKKDQIGSYVDSENNEEVITPPVNG